MKKLFYSYESVVWIFIALLWISCSKDEKIRATSIQIENVDHDGLQLEVEEEVQVAAKTLPENAERGGITYKSSDLGIFTVTAKGVLKGIAVGEAELLVKTQDGTYLRDARKVTVLPKTVIAESIEILGLEDDIFLASQQISRKVETKVYPEGASQVVTYKSSDESVFTVDDAGVIRGVALVGEGTLTVQSQRFPAVSVTCLIKIADLNITDIILPTTPVVIKTLGATFDLKAVLSVKPAGAEIMPLEFSSSNPDILKIDDDGVVRSVGRGTAEITVRATGNSTVERVISIDSEAELTYDGWTVTASSYHPGNGLPGTILIDGTSSSEFWHSNWEGNQAPLPHWLLIDMKSQRVINAFRVERRHTGRDLRFGTVEISEDGQQFTSVGVIDFGDADAAENTREISFSPVNARYIRFTITQSNRAPFAGVNRIRVYGALN